jgi:hypothetical protein
MPERSIAVPPPPDPLLPRARVTFHTNDDDKDNDLVDLLFDDGAHLLARANGVQLKSRGVAVQQSFGIE